MMIESVQQYGLVGLVVYVVVKEAFSFARWRNGKGGTKLATACVDKQMCIEHERRISGTESTVKGINGRLDRIEHKLDQLLSRRGDRNG